MTLLTEELRGYIGQEAVYEAPEPLGRASLRYFALAVGDPNPVYTHEEAARAAGYDDVIAPPTFVCETNQYLDRRPDEEGYLGHSWDLPVGEVRTIRGGHDYELLHPVGPHHRLRVTWRIEDMDEKTSSSGAAMLIVTSVAEYEDITSDELLAVNRETVIYQELS